jgi:hypothetical protein
MLRSRWLVAPALAALMAALPLGFAQDGQKEKSEQPTKKGGPPGSGLPKAGELKKYDDVITKEMTTQAGVFAVHRLDDKMYFEIPADKFGRLVLWSAEVAKGPGGDSWGGNALASRVLRFERRGNKVYLWKAGFRKRSDGKAVQQAVENASTDTIIAVFNVECEGKDRSVVINMSDIFISGIPDMPVGDASGAVGSVDPTRSYLSEVKAFPTNIEVRTMLTFRIGGGGPPRVGPPSLGGPSGPSASALVHHSLVILSETPMTARFFDPRVGYFTESYTDYSAPRGWAQRREYITRFRLEKKDPAAAVSEPVKPITYYLASEIPEKWRPFIKKGVEDWNAAFEKAGFKNAVVCKDAPTKAEDPTWDPEDARFSVIRWVAEPTQNAMGPHVADPRSGEIISAHIIFWHDVVKLAQMWYFMQCSGVDERARKLPLPDEVTGELMRYVACHEVGHTLGLRHNHRASTAYSVSQLRDPAFCEKHGSVASIMSYGRFNYVCQPEDKVKCLIPKLGPYDYFAIEWGYKPVAGAKTAGDEKKALDELAAKQIEEPFLRFGGEDGPAGVDPTVLTQNIGSDPLEATALGLKNLDRAADYLLGATAEKGEDYALLKDGYGMLLSHREYWFGAVMKQVGGVVEYRTLAGRGDETFVRVPRERQKEAVKFLNDHAFTTPTKLLNPKVVNQFKYNGVANDIADQQQRWLGQLLGTGRLNRLFDAEVLDPAKAYTAVELVTDVHDGLFVELKADAPKVDPLRRQLQRSYVEILRREFQPADSAPATPRFRGRGDDDPPVSELRAVARMSLKRLEKQLADALPKVKDASTRAHLEDLAAEVHTILTEKK